jgi:hypothetical protein
MQGKNTANDPFPPLTALRKINMAQAAHQPSPVMQQGIVMQTDREPGALDTRLQHFMCSAQPDESFDTLALALFAFQFANNTVYRGFCERRGATPGAVTRWQDIPAVPAAAFKSLRLATFPAAETVCTVRTSGTSGQVPGDVHLDAPAMDLAAVSYRGVGERLLFPDGLRRRALMLMPPLDQVPQMAMAHAARHAFSASSIEERIHFVDKGKLDVPGFVEALRRSETRGEPVVVFGASFGFVHLLDGLKGTRFQLTPGSLLIDGGGYKGRSRELSALEFAGSIQHCFGIPDDHWINVLGMTEMQTAFADGVAADRCAGRPPRRSKRGTPWSRTQVLSPETMQALPAGSTGLLCHWSLANRSTAMAVVTDDLGVMDGEGFRILGRAEGTEARGCSIAVDELLSVVKTAGA